MTVLDEFNTSDLLHVFEFCIEIYTSLRSICKDIKNKMDTHSISLRYILNRYGKDVYNLIRLKPIPLLKYITSDEGWISLMKELYPEITPHIAYYVPQGKWNSVLIDNLKNRVRGKTRTHIIGDIRNIEYQLQCYYENTYNYTVAYGDIILIPTYQGRSHTINKIQAITDKEEFINTTEIPYSILSREDFPLSYWKGYIVELNGCILQDIISNIVYNIDKHSYSLFTYMNEIYKVTFEIMYSSVLIEEELTASHKLTEEELKRMVYISITYDETIIKLTDAGVPVFFLKCKPSISLYMMDDYEFSMDLYPEFINSEYVEEVSE